MIKPFQLGRLDDAKHLDYQGTLMFTPAGLHPQIAELIPSGSEVLDVGSGEGALARRLEAQGCKVDTIDQSRATYCLDLNSPDWPKKTNRKYPYVVATEVIEHLENPRMFVRQLAKCCDAGGHIIISTPNLEQPLSHVRFLASGTFVQFDVACLQYKHISPMPEFFMKTAIKDAGLRLLDVILGGIYPFIYWNGRLKDSLLWSIANIILFPFGNMAPSKVYVIRKDA